MTKLSKAEKLQILVDLLQSGNRQHVDAAESFPAVLLVSDEEQDQVRAVMIKALGLPENWLHDHGDFGEIRALLEGAAQTPSAISHHVSESTSVLQDAVDDMVAAIASYKRRLVESRVLLLDFYFSEKNRPAGALAADKLPQIPAAGTTPSVRVSWEQSGQKWSLKGFKRDREFEVELRPEEGAAGKPVAISWLNARSGKLDRFAVTNVEDRYLVRIGLANLQMQLEVLERAASGHAPEGGLPLVEFTESP